MDGWNQTFQFVLFGSNGLSLRIQICPKNPGLGPEPFRASFRMGLEPQKFLPSIGRGFTRILRVYSAGQISIIPKPELRGF